MYYPEQRTAQRLFLSKELLYAASEKGGLSLLIVQLNHPFLLTNFLSL
jgi:hypothetical protein